MNIYVWIGLVVILSCLLGAIFAICDNKEDERNDENNKC